MVKRKSALVTAVTVTTMLAVALPANAQSRRPYDHADPYRTGCADTARVVKSAAINSKYGRIGTIKLMWSSRCKTNWIETETPPRVRGTITVYAADGRRDRFAFRENRNGRHWGDMLWADKMCAWGDVRAQVTWDSRGHGGYRAFGGTGKACG